MAAPSRQQPQRSDGAPRRRIVATIRATVAGIRRLVGQSVTTTRGLPARAGRRLNSLARRGRAAERGPGAAKRAAPSWRRPIEAEPAKARGRTRRTREPQAKPRQATRGQDPERQTVRELRLRAREAGIEGRSSMTRDQLIKALRDHRSR
jgi:Rho termination factor, N-terminal domain